MTNITQTSFSSAVKTQFERRLLMRAVPRLVHGRFGIKAKLNKYGSLEWRKYGSLSAVTTALTEGTTPAEQPAPSITSVTATPLFYGAWIGHSDEIDFTAFDPFVSEVSGILGEQAGVSADTLIRNYLTDGATKDYSGNVAGRSSLDSPTHDVTYLDFIKQIAQLEADNAMPVEGDKYPVVCHPHDWATLMADPTFVNLFVRESPSPLRSGLVGSVLRANIYLTSNSRKYVDGGVSGDDVYSMLFIGKESIGVSGIAGVSPNVVDGGGQGFTNNTGAGERVAPVELIVKGLGSAGADDPLNQRGTIAWKFSLDVDVLNATWLRDLEHTNMFAAD
jgi:N4-gp56 family major capsid protein